MRGCYVLLLKLERQADLSVGRLGSFCFSPGYYAYVGSALRGMEARVARHLRREKRMHWHVDYLLEVAEVDAVFCMSSENRCECAVAGIIRSLRGAQVPVRRFGSSDCSCEAHLFHFPENPEQAIYSALRRFSRESNLTLIPERFAE
ncbi:GIY-YIG nuclease family protein [Candidatus Pyrohabitans sp.]